MQAPFNNVIVKIKTKYIGNMTNILKMSAIQQGASVDPCDLVNIVGEVVSIPKEVTSYMGHEGYSIFDIKVGDTAIFSHNVIWSFLPSAPEEDPAYQNMFVYKGVEYFLCEIQNLFGVIRQGEVIMLNGNVMIYDFPDAGLVLNNPMQKKLRTTESEVMYIGYGKKGDVPVKSVSAGDTIVFNPAKSTKYQINGKPFRLLSQSNILAVRKKVDTIK